MRIVFFIFLVLLLLSCQANLYKTKVTDIEGHKMTVGTVVGDSLVVLVWLAADCPISQKQVLTLNQLARQFPMVPFIGVFTHWDQLADLQRFKRDFAPVFPLMRDGKGTLLKQMKPTVTPEVQLLKKRKVVYQGAVDNWYYAPGRHRPKPNEHYLENAIQAVLQSKQVAKPYVIPIGCRIE